MNMSMYKVIILSDIVYCMIKCFQPLPIQFDSTSEEEFRDTIAQIQDTGSKIIVITVTVIIITTITIINIIIIKIIIIINMVLIKA